MGPHAGWTWLHTGRAGESDDGLLAAYLRLWLGVLETDEGNQADQGQHHQMITLRPWSCPAITDGGTSTTLRQISAAQRARQKSTSVELV